MADQPYVPPQGPPQVFAPQVYDKVGSDRLHAFAQLFYQKLAASNVGALFPQSEDELMFAADKQAEFLIGVLGGPKLYMEKYGHPRLRSRHLPFVIDEAARQEWLLCFRAAFTGSDSLGLSPIEQQELLDWIEQFSGWMVNKASEVT